jgi:hypothetical protein
MARQGRGSTSRLDVNVYHSIYCDATAPPSSKDATSDIGHEPSFRQGCSCLLPPRADIRCAGAVTRSIAGCFRFFTFIQCCDPPGVRRRAARAVSELERVSSFQHCFVSARTGWSFFSGLRQPISKRRCRSGLPLPQLQTAMLAELAPSQRPR